MKQPLRTALLLALPLIVAGCNTDYNFDNISLEVTVGDTEGITVPIGSTDNITLESLLSESGIQTDENGNYGFSFGDQLSYNVELGTIDPITGIIPTITPTTFSLIGDINADIPLFEASKSLSLPQGVSANMEIPENFPLLGEEFHMHYDPHTFEGEFQVEIPEEISAIKTIRFGSNGEGSIIDIQFDLGGMADVSDKRTIEKFNIELPAGFTIEKLPDDPIGDYVTVYAGEGSSTPNHFHIENYEMTGDHLAIDILVRSISLETMNIDESGLLHIDEDVTYDLDFTGTFKSGTISSVAPKVSIRADLALYDASIITNNIAHSIEAHEQFAERVEIPAEVKEIHSIAIVDNATGGEATLRLALGVENSPVEKIELRDVEITLPSYITLSTVGSEWSYKGGVLSAEKITLDTAGSGEIATFVLSGIGALSITDGHIDLSGDISIKATAAIPSNEEITIGVHHEDVVLTPEITISDLRIESITGIVEPDLGDLLKPIEVVIGDFSSSLEGLEMELNIASPLLCINIDNPIGVGLDATIQIDAYKSGGVAKTITTPTLSILPSNHTSIIITGEDSDVAYPDSADTFVYQVEGLSELIGLLPDKLVLQLDASTNKDKPHTITLEDSYTFGIDYSVEAPISFSDNKDGRIAYTTTIEDVDLSSLGDIDVEVESVVLNISSESTLPIDLSLALEMLDAEGAPIPSIAATSTGTIKGTAGSESATSKCSVTLAIDAPEGSNPFAELAKTKSVRCKIEGTTLAGGGLNKNQYITFDLSLLLDKGITIDLGSLGGEETPTEE